MKLGAHMPTAGGVWKALERGRAVGCEVVQIFVKNNLQWRGRPFPTEVLERYRAEFAASQFAAVFGHAGYLINLAAPPSPTRDKSIQSLVQEIQLATELGLPFLVLHPGSHLGKGETAGLENLARALNEVCRVTRDSPVRIALEITAGQGSCLGYRIEHLAEAYENADRPERLGLCLDTAHLFAAGYDIRSLRCWNAVIHAVEEWIGLREILAFHLNDSKTPLRSRVDRHEHIGRGRIGLGSFKHILNDSRFKNHPACLETPKSDDLHEDIENLAALRSLLAPKRKASRPS
jgi:deoxyribonuclease-4